MIKPPYTFHHNKPSLNLTNVITIDANIHDNVIERIKEACESKHNIVVLFLPKDSFITDICIPIRKVYEDYDDTNETVSILPGELLMNFLMLMYEEIQNRANLIKHYKLEGHESNFENAYKFYVNLSKQVIAEYH